MSTKYQFLFFDLDHTLWDFEKNSIATLEVLYSEKKLGEKGINSFADFQVIYHEINDKLWDRFRKGFLSREDLRWKRMWQTLVHYKIFDEVLAKEMSERYLEILPEQKIVFPFAKDLLQYCTEKNYELHMITNGFELTQHQKLKNADLSIYFDQMITSEMALSMKPQKEIFEYALAKTGAKATNSLMIGDALDIDILGAQRVGMDQVYFNPKNIPHEQKPTFEINCLSELMKLI